MTTDSTTTLELPRPAPVRCSDLLDPESETTQKETLNELHLFAGCGGGILGGILCGHRTICAVEIEPYCRKILLQRQRDGILPRFPIWDDVRTFDGKPWRGIADIVCGGFPCQDISAAGNGDGLDGERSGLWEQMRRIVGETRPRFVFVENSPMLVIRGLDRVLADLAALGFDATWGIMGAHHAGEIHKRERIWILAYTPEVRQPAFQIPAEIVPARPLDSITAGVRGTLIRDEDMPTNNGANDELAEWVDRFAAIGNGQVPSVAALAWNTLRRGRGV